jgi:hypothetical protein
MSYGFKWNEAKQRYYVGGDAGGCFVRQVSEMQPRGHWVRAKPCRAHKAPARWMALARIQRLQGT